MRVVGNSRGFSLVELMVSVAIVGILASMATQNLSNFTAKARINRVGSELAGLKTGLESIRASYGYYPDSGTQWTAALPVALQYGVDCNTPGRGKGVENDQAFTELCKFMSTLDPAASGMPKQSPYCGEPVDYLYISNGLNYQLLAYCFDRSELSPLANTFNRCSNGVCWGLSMASQPLSQSW